MRYSKIKLITQDKIKYKLQFLDKIPMIEVTMIVILTYTQYLLFSLCIYITKEFFKKKLSFESIGVSTKE